MDEDTTRGARVARYEGMTTELLRDEFFRQAHEGGPANVEPELLDEADYRYEIGDDDANLEDWVAEV